MRVPTPTFQPPSRPKPLLMQTPGRRFMQWAVVVVTMAAAVVPAVTWVGDISYRQDEPRLLAKAWHANQRHAIETRGLNGNFGLPYGPLPTQIYQAILLFTHNPLIIAAVRAGLCAGLTAAALLWLARSLRLCPWFATAVVLAPYLWNFQRLLWDASFAIPIGSVALAAYASFLRTSSGRSLLVAFGTTAALAFIHPQDLPLMLPIAGHALWRHRPALARHYAGIAVILGVMLALNAAYFREAYYAVAWHVIHGSMKTAYDGTHSRAESLCAPLLGGSLLSGYTFAKQDSQLPESPALRAAMIASRLIYPLIWGGIGVAVFWLIRLRPRTRDEVPYGHDEILRAVRRAVAGIALAGLALQMLLYGAMRMPAAPQYFFGTFILHVLFAWMAVDALGRVRLQCVTIAVYGFACGSITLASLLYVHRHGYARDTVRPSLADQVAIVRELNQYPNPVVVTDVPMFQRFPQALRSLRLLMPPQPGQTHTPGQRLMIRHRSGPQGVDSAVEVIAIPPGMQPADGATPIDVTPLPAHWEPEGW